MPRPRDSQMSKVYRAERRSGTFGRRLETVPECQAYVNRLWTSAWFERTFPRDDSRSWKPPIITDGRGARIARGGPYRIKLPVWSRSELIILHEVAHSAGAFKRDQAHHGPEFCARFLLLVRHCMGVKAEKMLRSSFQYVGVRYRPKRQLTPERLEALRARGRDLAAARGAKNFS